MSTAAATPFASTNLACAYGRPPCTGIIRAHVEDFQVDEVLDFEPDGEGEHILLQIEKRDLNTEQVVRMLARHAQVKTMDVGYAGLKDKRAVTTQWFSVRVPGKAMPDWQALTSEQLRILQVVRHGRKLRRGVLRANRFDIRVRELAGDTSGLETRIAAIAKEGVPNYFGEQRFGRDGNNLRKADALFNDALRVRDRHKRGIYLSAARSWLFNRVLSRRVADGTWDRALPGEVLMLDGSHSFFAIDEPDATIEQRLAEMDVHPSGPLWGRGELPTQGVCRELEASVLQPYGAWCAGLERAGMEQKRRSLRRRIDNLSWEHDGSDLFLRFELGPSGYATSVLREIVAYETAATVE